MFNAGVEATDETVRKSEKALIDRDEVVQCIEQRALSIQGWPHDTFIERLWTQRYNVSGHYSYHYDWSTATKEAMRVSTFMVYLKADCEGGGVCVLCNDLNSNALLTIDRPTSLGCSGPKTRGGANIYNVRECRFQTVSHLRHVKAVRSFG